MTIKQLAFENAIWQTKQKTKHQNAERKKQNAKHSARKQSMQRLVDNEMEPILNRIRMWYDILAWLRQTIVKSSNIWC